MISILSIFKLILHRRNRAEYSSNIEDLLTSIQHSYSSLNFHRTKASLHLFLFIPSRSPREILEKCRILSFSLRENVTGKNSIACRFWPTRRHTFNQYRSHDDENQETKLFNDNKLSFNCFVVCSTWLSLEACQFPSETSSPLFHVFYDDSSPFIRQ